IVADLRITITEEKANELGRHRMRLGDIGFARRGEMGRCGLITDDEKGWLCGTGSLLVRCKPGVLQATYAVMLLSQAGVRDQLILESVGATMDNLNTRILSKLKLPIPPLAEQHAIVAFLN